MKVITLQLKRCAEKKVIINEIVDCMTHYIIHHIIIIIHNIHHIITHND